MPDTPLTLLEPAAPAGERTRWATRELMARLRLPWRKLLTGATPPPGGIVLAVGQELPGGAAGVELIATPGAQDPQAVARCLTEGDLPAAAVQAVGVGRTRLTLDLAATFEDWLGRKEETQPQDLDHVGRMRHESSRLAAATADTAPVADLLAEQVARLLSMAAREARLPLPVRTSPWPDGAKFAVHLSHDVDVLSGRGQLWRRYAAWTARCLKARLSGRRDQAAVWAAKIRRFRSCGDDPHYTIPGWLELEGRYGARSSFYFFCSRSLSTAGRRIGRMYRLSDPLARQSVRMILAAGSEAGVHAFPRDFRSAARLAASRALLEAVAGEPCPGIRQHFLRLSVPDTWQAQRQAGFEYDATLGWPAHVGMRAGTCHPFETWDPLAARGIGLMELPLIAMDGAMSQAWGSPQTWMDNLQPILRAVEQVQGVFSLLVHPDHLDGVDFPGQREFVETFLQEMRARGGWVRSGRDILRACAQHRAACCLESGQSP
jgi:hypothetical protein